jgi:hypothetical protein
LQQYILPEGNNWYKGNLHMHTTRSDGHLDYEAALREYESHGYDFVAVTDHRKPSEAGEQGRMLVLPGVEWDTGDGAQNPVYHILGIGMTRASAADYQQNHSPSPQELVQTVLDADGVAILCHPSWSVMDPAGITCVKGISGAEIYNTVSGLPWNGERADSSVWFDIWASGGTLVPAVAGDDSHTYTGEQCRSFVMVNAAACTRDDIVGALRSGAFYASQGPRFKALTLDIACGIVHVEFSEDVKTVVFYSNVPWPAERVMSGAAGHVDYHISPSERYLRVELLDDSGCRAWSSPFAL